MEIEKKIKVNLSYKKDGRLSFARINLIKEYLKILGLNKENRNIELIYENKIIQLKKVNSNSKKVIRVSYEKSKNNFKFCIPLPIVREWELEKEENNNVIIDKKEDYIEIRREEMTIETDKKKKGKFYIVKVAKGGSGKTLVAVTLAYLLALIKKYKVVIFSTDTQNDHLYNLLSLEEVAERGKNIIKIEDDGDVSITKGLKTLVIKNGNYENFIINARENLDVIPLESDIFNFKTKKEINEFQKFKEKFPDFIEKLKENYDIIIGDGIPVLNIDDFAVNCADKVIIPVTADEATIKGAIRMVQSIGVDKIHAILVNKYRNTSTRNYFLDELKEKIGKTDIIFPEPVKELSQIEQLIKNKKTLFESKSKYLKEAQISFIDIAKEM